MFGFFFDFQFQLMFDVYKLSQSDIFDLELFVRFSVAIIFKIPINYGKYKKKLPPPDTTPTMLRTQAFSFIAPQQPKKPRMKMRPPTTQRVMAAARMSCSLLPLIATTLIRRTASSSINAQMDTASNAAPAIWIYRVLM